MAQNADSKRAVRRMPGGSPEDIDIGMTSMPIEPHSMPSDSLLDRRQACRRLLAGAAAALTSAVSTAGPENPRFALRYVLASSMYGKTPLEEILSQVDRAGAEAIDIWPQVHANQREQMEEMGDEASQRLLERYGVQLGMTTRYDLGPFRLADEIAFVHKFGGRIDRLRGAPRRRGQAFGSGPVVRPSNGATRDRCGASRRHTGHRKP